MNAYSETQVTNFLKRASFNRKIHNSAKTYAGGGIGTGGSASSTAKSGSGRDNVVSSSSSSSGGIDRGESTDTILSSIASDGRKRFFLGSAAAASASFASMPSASSSTSFSSFNDHIKRSRQNGDNKPKAGSLAAMEQWLENQGNTTDGADLENDVSGSDNKSSGRQQIKLSSIYPFPSTSL